MNTVENYEVKRVQESIKNSYDKDAMVFIAANYHNVSQFGYSPEYGLGLIRKNNFVLDFCCGLAACLVLGYFGFLITDMIKGGLNNQVSLLLLTAILIILYSVRYSVALKSMPNMANFKKDVVDLLLLSVKTFIEIQLTGNKQLAWKFSENVKEDFSRYKCLSIYRAKRDSILVRFCFSFICLVLFFWSQIAYFWFYDGNPSNAYVFAVLFGFFAADLIFLSYKSNNAIYVINFNSHIYDNNDLFESKYSLKEMSREGLGDVLASIKAIDGYESSVDDDMINKMVKRKMNSYNGLT